MQSDLFLDFDIAELCELQKAKSYHEEKLRYCSEKIRELTQSMKVRPLSEDKEVELIFSKKAGHTHATGQRAFLRARSSRGDRIILPISLDLLYRAVEEFSCEDNRVHGTDGSGTT